LYRPGGRRYIVAQAVSLQPARRLALIVSTEVALPGPQAFGRPAPTVVFNWPCSTGCQFALYRPGGCATGL